MGVFEDLYDEVLNLLASRGKGDGFGKGDFWVNANDYGHNAVGAFIQNPDVFDMKLVEEIQGALRRIDATWSVFLTIALARSEDDEWDAETSKTIEILVDRVVEK